MSGSEPIGGSSLEKSFASCKGVVVKEEACKKLSLPHIASGKRKYRDERTSSAEKKEHNNGDWRTKITKLSPASIRIERLTLILFGFSRELGPDA